MKPRPKRGPAQGAPCPGCARVAAAMAGGDPSLIAVLPRGILLLGDHQAYPGYAVLWSRTHAKELHHLAPRAYAGFMDDLRRASAAVEAATHCAKLNVVSLGNAVPHAHLHLFPRSARDPQRLKHPWIHEDRFSAPPSGALRRHWVELIRMHLERRR